MDIRIAIAVALMAGTAAQAAEPPVPANSSKSQSAALVPTSARAPLKLGIGDVRKYMMPNDYRAALNAADADKTTVIVQGERAVAPLQSERAAAGGARRRVLTIPPSDHGLAAVRPGYQCLRAEARTTGRSPAAGIPLGSMKWGQTPLPVVQLIESRSSSVTLRAAFAKSSPELA